MGFKPKEIENQLVNKFHFEIADNRGEDHRYYVLQIDDTMPLIQTHFSHNNKEIRDKLEHEILHQLHVRKPFFYEMMNCTKSREEYYRQVKEAPFPPFPDWLLKRVQGRKDENKK